MPTRFKLNTGAEIPAMGFGTWQDEKAQEDAIVEAIKAGYRHIDTAVIYGTEKHLGRALQRCGVPRDQLFITTKLWSTQHHPDDVPAAFQQSLSDLQTDYVDLYLIHWPVAWKRGAELMPMGPDGKPIMEDTDNVDTYKAMEKIYQTGKAKAIGISNFSKYEMENLLKKCSVTPAVHQIECHPWLQQRDFLEWHRGKGIHMTHYSALGNQNEIYGNAGQKIGKMIDEPILQEVAKKHGKSSAQVAIAWGVTQGHSVLSKSKTPSRIKSNLEGDFKLDEDDMAKIRTINKKMRFNDSSGDFGRDFFQDLEPNI
ncbi:aldehyde reductase AKR1 [Aspergillus sp. HF37]|nr:aldehyde reductase AKR1 [Aspergillus sp. HF37]